MSIDLAGTRIVPCSVKFADLGIACRFAHASQPGLCKVWSALTPERASIALQMREGCANFAVLKSRCETAAVQQREAASNLQRAFHPPDQALRDVYGEGTQDHEQLDASGTSTIAAV